MAEEENKLKGYGFVDSISTPTQGANSKERLDIVLDFISAEAVDSGNGISRNVEDLSIVRIMTTEGRLESLFGLERISEGSWLKVTFEDRPGNPLAWILDATEDYGGNARRTNVIGLEKMAEGHGGPPQASLFNSLAQLCNPTQFQSDQISAPQQTMLEGQDEYHLRVVDVGQASFCAIHTHRKLGSEILGYFDVGAPIFFHNRSFPRTFEEGSRIPKDGFVVLSHWDFDHYSMAVTKLKALQDLKWIAPNQSVGPNAARLQSLLGAKLTILNTNTFTIAPGLALHRGTGPTTDRNNNGFLLTVAVEGGNVLLAGDVGYDKIPSAAQNNLVGLNISHHGGKTTGTPPAPSRDQCVAAVSYGIPNRYGHPNADNIKCHGNLNWLVQPTHTSATRRGDVWLG